MIERGVLAFFGCYLMLVLPLAGLVALGLIRLLNKYLLDPYDPEEEAWRATVRRAQVASVEPDEPRADDGRVGGGRVTCE